MFGFVASLARIVALSAALGALYGAMNPAHANGDVYNDNGARIGTAQDCDGEQCDVVNDAGQHIGQADDCQYNDSCDVTNDDGDHIGTVDNDDSN